MSQDFPISHLPLLPLSSPPQIKRPSFSMCRESQEETWKALAMEAGTNKVRGAFGTQARSPLRRVKDAALRTQTLDSSYEARVRGEAVTCSQTRSR